jgi:hypothetical protein
MPSYKDFIKILSHDGKIRYKNKLIKISSRISGLGKGEDSSNITGI